MTDNYRSNRQKESKKGKQDFFRRFILPILHGKILIALIVIAALTIIGIGLKSKFFTEATATKLGFENIGELTTQAAYTKEISVTNEFQELFGIKLPFTQTKYIYSYDVDIKAGFNFEEITQKINHEKKEITLNMPKPKITSSEIDPKSFKVFHEDESIFTPISLKKNNESLEKIQDQAEKSAIDNGLFDKAKENGEILLKNFISQNKDVSSYEVKFVYEK